MINDITLPQRDNGSTALLTLEHHWGNPDPHLEFCSRSDARYKCIRDRHYVVNKGACGQQLHFLIHHKNEIVGIISGGSSAYATRNRDNFFHITKANRSKSLNGLINNIVFRLEKSEPKLATRCLSMWRWISAYLWEELYDVKVYGFETFVVEAEHRKGTLYKADNWECTGVSSGSTKSHDGVGLGGSSTRQDIIPKLIFCKWHNNHREPIEQNYVSSWRGQTVEEKNRARRLSRFRKLCLGRKFCAVKNMVLLVR